MIKIGDMWEHNDCYEKVQYKVIEPRKTPNWYLTLRQPDQTKMLIHSNYASHKNWSLVFRAKTKCQCYCC